MDISNERKKALKQAYKEKAAEEELHRRIRNLDDFRRLWKELVQDRRTFFKVNCYGR
jgi:DNA polymerase sigma